VENDAQVKTVRWKEMPVKREKNKPEGGNRENSWGDDPQAQPSEPKGGAEQQTRFQRRKKKKEEKESAGAITYRRRWEPSRRVSPKAGDCEEQ